MKKLLSVLISSLLLTSTVACNNVAKTSEQAPESTNTSTQPPEANKAQEIHKDGTSEIRRQQLDADIRAREQRNQAAGKDPNRTDDDLRSEVRSKLEANLPDSQLSVDAKDGNVKISGTVPTTQQYRRIGTLAREIYGVKAVEMKVNIAPAKR